MTMSPDDLRVDQVIRYFWPYGRVWVTEKLTKLNLESMVHDMNSERIVHIRELREEEQILIEMS